MQRYTDGPDLQGEITPRRIQSCAHSRLISVLEHPPDSGKGRAPFEVFQVIKRVDLAILGPLQFSTLAPVVFRVSGQ